MAGEAVNSISTAGTHRNRISVVIPTYNEADIIGHLVKHLKRAEKEYLMEIIVADGNSTDGTIAEAEAAGATVVVSPKKGRAAQMNAGADMARGDIIYFLHSDTYPPKHYDEMIIEAVSDHPWGSFRMKFDHQHWFLSFITWFTRLDFIFFRFGDQSLFVKKALFNAIGKFNASQIIFEDTEIARRLRLSSKGRIVAIPVTTSARKFRDNGVYKMSLIFSYLWILYVLGVPHDKILARYKKLIIQDKI